MMKILSYTLFALLVLTANCVIADNPPTNHVCKFDFVVTTNHISSPSIRVINLTAGGPYWLTGSNVSVSVSGEAVTNVLGKHEIIGTPTPLYCDVVLSNGVCGAKNPYTATYDTKDVAPDSYTYDWTLGANPKVPGSGNSFSGTTTVSTPGPYTLIANFKGTVKDCGACTCYASGTTNCTISKLEIVVELEDPKTNSVRSGLNMETLKFILNGKEIPYEKLKLMPPEIDYVPGGIIWGKIKIHYVPDVSELNFIGENTVSVDIKDGVGNVMKQEVKTFKVFNSGSESGN
jgi:hypothetical protein